MRHAALQLKFKGFLLHLPITAAGAVNHADERWTVNYPSIEHHAEADSV